MNKSRMNTTKDKYFVIIWAEIGLVMTNIWQVLNRCVLKMIMAEALYVVQQGTMIKVTNILVQLELVVCEPMLTKVNKIREQKNPIINN